MGERGRRIFAFWLSVIGHALIVVALTFSIPLSPLVVTPGEVIVPIDTVMIDEAALDARMAEIEAARQAEIRAERERVRAAEQQRRDEARAAEQQRIRIEAEARAEEERLAQIERDRIEAEERAAEEQRRQEEEAERQRQAELAREREEAERRRRQEEAVAETNRVAAAEAEERAARDSGALDQWTLAISNDIKQRWIKPPNMPDDLQCIVEVTMIISGDVRGARIVSCTPNEASLIRSVENAVLNASPLPPPPSRALFQPTLRIRFIP